MAISEKTIELNLTRSIIEKMRRTHQKKVYSLGATQDEESKLGFDVDISDGAWCGGIIQYKRLYVQANGNHIWHLNRTVRRDQHSLLLILEGAGFPVFYCFPKFDDEITLSSWSPPSLWKNVWWVKPSSIPVPAPVDSHHDVEFSLIPPTWIVHSDSVEFELDEISFEDEFIDRIIEMDSTMNLRRLKQLISASLLERVSGESDEFIKQYFSSTLRGVNLICAEI